MAKIVQKHDLIVISHQFDFDHGLLIWLLKQAHIAGGKAKVSHKFVES